MSTLTSLHALLIDEIKDLYFAENQLLKALPKMAKAAANPKLKQGFIHHLAQTRVHVARLARALKGLGCPPKGKTCHAMLGLVKEGAEAIGTKGPAAIRDANLIGAAQRVEHYEMAGYGTASAFARELDEDEVVGLLQLTLTEERQTNQALNEISVSVNTDALAAGGQISRNRKSKR